MTSGAASPKVLAAWWRGIWVVGGTLQLTSDALVFRPNGVERVLGWRDLRIDRDRLRVVAAEPGMRGLVVEADQRVHRFNVNDSCWLSTTFPLPESSSQPSGQGHQAPTPSGEGAEDEVLAAARARGRALGSGDEPALRALLHPGFVWTSHRGDVFDREGYLRSNTGSTNTWYGQHLEEPVVVVDGDVAVLRCVVADDVDTGTGRHTARMLMTQTWVRHDSGWVCIAGHAGPRLD